MDLREPNLGDHLIAWWDERQARPPVPQWRPPPRQTPSDRRHLDTEDIASFDVAIQQPPTDRAMLAASLKSRYPMRIRRMEKDMKWLRKRMLKLGLNPEDAPWLL